MVDEGVGMFQPLGKAMFATRECPASSSWVQREPAALVKNNTAVKQLQKSAKGMLPPWPVCSGWTFPEPRLCCLGSCHTSVMLAL